ncbi:isoprenylcysteine carboxylmethyltransferase family protein [bacterium]|jgi:protein-S-isoprenylcysteine O-methyltransferase Ste14|nr:isoprenylcysteine carboxylmethyltransferase family protein [bacterium]
MEIETDSAQVQFPPPLALLAFNLLGVFLHYVVYPLPFLSEGLHLLRWILGGAVFISCVVLVVFLKKGFDRVGTNIKPWQATHKIITSGVYAYSRNPIYVCFIVSGFALAVIFNTLWIPLLMLGFIYLIRTQVIAKEEAYLEKKFGAEYLNYKSRVRRWL